MAEQEEIVKFQLRIPAELHEALKSSAEKNGRSLNAEIALRLDLSRELAEAPSTKQQSPGYAFSVMSLLAYKRALFEVTDQLLDLTSMIDYGTLTKEKIQAAHAIGKKNLEMIIEDENIMKGLGSKG